MAPAGEIFRGGSRPAPRPRSKFADFTPPAAEPLARLLPNCPIDGQFFTLVCASGTTRTDGGVAGRWVVEVAEGRSEECALVGEASAPGRPVRATRKVRAVVTRR